MSLPFLGLTTSDFNPAFYLLNNGDADAMYVAAQGAGDALELQALAGHGLYVKGGNGPASALRVSASQAYDAVEIADPSLAPRIRMKAKEVSTQGAALWMYNAANLYTVDLDADYNDGAARLDLRDGDQSLQVKILARDNVEGGGGALIELFNGADERTIVLDADDGGNGEGRLICDVLEIRGGADLTERFETTGAPVEPGTVVVIDPLAPGKLRASDAAYDPRVAGVVSGAGGVKPGLELGQRGVADGDVRVALSGRVYVRCSAEGGAIRPGDLLTTAVLPGHAMRAGDSHRAFGAVLGKAMSGLDAGTGLVLVLVNLQ